MNTLFFSMPYLIDIGGAIEDFFQELIENYVFAIFYYIEIAMLYVLKLLEDIMLIFTGEAPVVYNGEENSLLNVFFSHDSVRGVYMGIGMVGIIFAFAFAIVSVIRKMFDSRGKYQSLTLGAILGNLLKSILLIFGMNAILLVSINATNILLQAVNDSFILSNDLVTGAGTPIEFTDEQYAAMGRILNTIGNYSLNPSYRSRYNLNACYNDIRTDLKYLGDQGVFRYHYESYDENDNEIITWQSLMEELGTAYDYNKETTLDTYDDGITNAILDCMEIIKQNPNIRVLKSYQGTTHEYTGRVSLDRIMFLVGTMGTVNTAAARNDAYNRDPNFYDNIRAPFYYGSKDMYSFSQVREVFSVSPLKMNYVIVFISTYEIAMEMMIVIVTCGVRIFNLLALYLVAPLAIATMPMDDGAKFKQWTTAFVVQLLSVLGMVIAIRLFILLLPIIWSPALSVGDAGVALEDWDVSSTEATLNLVNKLLNLLLTMILKIVLTYTAVQAINKVNGIFTGILADNAGMQAITAGDMRKEFAETGVGRFMNAHKPLGGTKQQSQEKRPVNGGGKGGEGSESEAVDKTSKGMQKANANVAKPGGGKDGADKREKDMKMLDAAVKHGQETGRRMDGKKLSKDGKDLAIMKGTLEHMQKDGMNMKDAKAAAEKDYKADKEKKDAENKFHQKELKAGPPDRNKAQKQAAKMKDYDYKAMKRDLAFMKENGYHANGDAIKPGERAQMEETLKAYENQQRGDRGSSSGGSQTGDSTPGSQNSQVGGTTVAGVVGAATKGAEATVNESGSDTGHILENQRSQVDGKESDGSGLQETGANTIPKSQSVQVGGNSSFETSTGANTIPENQSVQVGGNSSFETSTGANTIPESQSVQAGENSSYETNPSTNTIPESQSVQVGENSSYETSTGANTIPGNQSVQVGGNSSYETSTGTNTIPENQSSQVGVSSTVESGANTIPGNQSVQVGGNSSYETSTGTNTISENQSVQVGGNSSYETNPSMNTIPENQSVQVGDSKANDEK